MRDHRSVSRLQLQNWHVFVSVSRLIDWMRAGIPEDRVNKVRTMKAVYIGALEYALDTVRGLQALNLNIEEDL